MSAEWREVQIGDLANVRHGFAFDGQHFVDEPTGDILATPGNFAIGGGFKLARPKYYQGPVPPEFVLNPGDLIVTMTDLSKNSDTLGYGALVPTIPNRRLLHNQRVGRVEIKREDLIVTGFLHWVLRSSAYRSEILASASGSAIKHTAPARISAYRFKLPPLNVQRAIVRALGSLDDKIELNRKMSVTLEAMARALFRSWFIDFDPVRAKAEGRAPAGMDAETAKLFPTELVESKSGPIPKGWRDAALVETSRFVMGQSPPGDTYNQAGDGLPFYQGSTDFGFRFPSRRVFCSAPTRRAATGDTLVSVRAPVGTLNMALEECALGRGVAAVRHCSGSASFTYNLIHFMRPLLERFNAEGTVFGSINRTAFESLRHIEPSPPVVRAFDAHVRALDRRLESATRESATLLKLRDELLPRLLSGELSTLDLATEST